RTLSQYDDFTFDDFDPDTPDYPSHDQLRRYFQAYARHFGLYDHIEFRTEVVHCARRGDRHWEVTLRRDGREWQERFTHLVVCNGHHWDPRWPDYPGTFTGEYLHSHQYKRAAPFAGKRVLVIGGGNSACDVAVETSRVSAFTAISWRRGYRILPKFIMGKPSDVVGEKLAWLPISIRARLSDFLIWVLQGPNELYGLPPVDVKFGQTHPTINDELLYRIRHGKVHPRPDIARFEGRKVHFKDGRIEEYDAVVACTGYRISHPFFDKSFIDYSEGPVPLYLRMMHPDYADLYFIGLFQPLGCIWPGAELQSKIMAREIAGKWQRPADIRRRIERELKRPHYRQLDTPRHTITVDYHVFRRQLLRHLPKDYVRKEPRRKPVSSR
ncbi:MAG: monooxygenase, partial [Bacteroidetes bacterium]